MVCLLVVLAGRGKSSTSGNFQTSVRCTGGLAVQVMEIVDAQKDPRTPALPQYVEAGELPQEGWASSLRKRRSQILFLEEPSHSVPEEAQSL